MLLVSNATTSMTAVDTNILIYAHDLRDPRKQRTAFDLLRSVRDGVLLWQVACEYLSASRKLEPQGFSYENAFADVATMRATWAVPLPTWGVLDRARLLRSAGFSHWDSLLVARIFRRAFESRR